MFPALKVDVSHFGRKEWTGTGFLYFFSWLAFFIFFVNPPLYDGVPPEVQIHVSPDVQTPGGLVEVSVLALDNVKVDEDSLRFEVLGPDGNEVAANAALEEGAHEASWRWSRTFDEAPEGTYTVRVSIADTGSGILDRGTHRAEEEVTFEVKRDALKVFLSGAGTFTSPDDSVRVEVPEAVDVYRVWLQKQDGTRIYLEQDNEAESEGHTVYRARANFDGWELGNNTFRVHAVEHDSYWLSKRYGMQDHTAELVSFEEHTVVIQDAQLLGDRTVSAPKERSATPAQTPGPGVALTLVGIIGVALFVARKRDQ